MMFTGTTQQQDTRFSDKEKKLMKQMKFGDCLNKRVDMSKVKLDVLRPWISKKITDILHIEDDVVVEFVYNQLEEEKFPCPKKMQINMTGFLNGRNARQFMGELWSLLLSAQESESGIPTEFIQQKKDEILKRDEDQKNEQQGRYHERSRSRDRDRDRRMIKERSSEKLSQREREQQLPPNTLTAIEQVRSQLSAKSRSASAENIDLFGCAQKKDVSNEHNNVSCGNGKTLGNRSKSPFARAIVIEASSEKTQNRSPRKSPQNRSQTSGATRNRGSSSRYCNSSRDRDRRRSSRSPKRRSPDRKHRRSRSRDRTDRRQPNNRRNSPSVSPFKTRTRSLDKRSNSRSPEKLKTSPRLENSKNRSRKKSVSSNSNVDTVNGHECVHTKKEGRSSEDRNVLINKRNKNRSQSRSLSMNSNSSSQKKKIKVVRSRSQSKKFREMPSSRKVSRSLTHSSVDSSHKRKVRNSTSQNTSLSLSPEIHKDNFEIRKNKDSVQKKRHYRSNRDSSMSSADHDLNKYQSDGRRREQFGRRYSPRLKTPRNEISGRNQRSWSRRRSRSPRNQSWSRNRSRSPMRRSRSPKRYTRRRSPLQHFRGRGGTNRGRLNNWRRSPSPRGRVGGGGSRFDRRYSPQQRRYSRERRSPLIQHNQFRKFSPIRRYSPHQQQRRQPSSRDRRPLSPHRRTSRERGGIINFNRWDQTKKSDSKQKLQPRSSSESSNWDKVGFSRKSNECGDLIDIVSPSKKNGRHEESTSREQHQPENSPFIVHPQKSKNFDQTSIENIGNSKASQESNDKKDDVARKAKSEEKIVHMKKKDVIKNKEIIQKKFRYSLSRTPSPFLKSHEREEICQKANSTISFKKVQRSNASDKRSQKTTDTSSSENSGDSEDSDNEDNHENKRKTSNNRKTLELAPKYENYSSSEDESNDESNGAKSFKITSKGQEAKIGTNANIKERDRDKDRIISIEDISDKRKLSANVHKQSEISKKFKTISNIEVVTSSITIEKFKGRVQHKKYNSSEESDGKTESVSIKNKNKTALKRSISASRLKKQVHDSMDSDDERVSKKKRKKLKKSSSKRNHSEYDEDESTSDSDIDHNIRRKKHKKHKKHSKKSKKHKKRKSKKSKKLGSASSSDKDDDNDDDNGNADIINNDNNYHKSLNIPGNATMIVSGINEDLERQLRERALKSMKKVD